MQSTDARVWTQNAFQLNQQRWWLLVVSAYLDLDRGFNSQSFQSASLGFIQWRSVWRL